MSQASPAADPPVSPPPPKALLSVYDKSQIVEFAEGLVDLGWELIASGGTAEVIAAQGIPVTDVADYTASPIMLGHRVATLHPRIHGGILADRQDRIHQADLVAHNIEPIDLVVCNLYPFAASPSVEMIDIGGPALLRAAAKNHAFVGVVTSPVDYSLVLEELRSNAPAGLLSTTRLCLARAAFAHCVRYDHAIINWFDQVVPSDDSTTRDSAETPVLPSEMQLTLERVEILRYGENPHQSGAHYRVRGTAGLGDRLEQLAGVSLSYLNYLDADAAWRLVSDLRFADDSCAVAIIKHANPCGVAVASNLVGAFEQALACDPQSAFGGVVAFSHEVDEKTAQAMVAGPPMDVVIAPGFTAGVVETLSSKRRTTRLVRLELLARDAPSVREIGLEIRQITDGFLVQQPQRFVSLPESWHCVTNRQPSASELSDAAFAWRVCGHVKSNAVVLARDHTAWGIGAGQQSRVGAAKLAVSQAAGRARGGVCASDAFFPFADGINAVADAGVAVVVQPGGSVNDTATIAAANDRGLAMLFTSERQFAH